WWPCPAPATMADLARFKRAPSAGCLIALTLASSTALAVGAMDPAPARPALVRVFALDAQGAMTTSGSGFILSAQGHILTSRHIVEDAAYLKVGRAGDDGELWEAQLLDQSVS